MAGLSLSSNPAESRETRELAPLAPLMQRYQEAQTGALEELRALTGARLRDRLQLFRVQENLEAPTSTNEQQERNEILQILSYAHPSLEQPRHDLVGRIMTEVRQAPIEQRRQVAQRLFDQLEAQNLVDPSLVGELIRAGFQLGGDDMIDIVRSADAQLVHMGKDAIQDFQGVDRNPNRPYPQDIAFGAYFASNLLEGPNNPLVRALIVSKSSEEFATVTARHFQDYLTGKNLSSTDYFVNQDFYTKLCDRFGIAGRLESIELDRYLDQESITRMNALFREDIRREEQNRDEALRSGQRELARRRDNEAEGREALQDLVNAEIAAAGVAPNVARSINVDTRHLQGTITQFAGVPLELLNSGINKVNEWSPRLPQFRDLNILSLGLGVGAATSIAIGAISLGMPMFTHGAEAVMHPFSAWQETKGLASDIWTQAPSIAGTMALAGAYLASSDPNGAAEWVGDRWQQVKALGQRAASSEIVSGVPRLIRRGYESLIEGRFEGTKETFENIWNWLKQQPRFLLDMSAEAWDRVELKARNFGLHIEAYRERYTTFNDLRSEVNQALARNGVRDVSGWTSTVSEEKLNTFLQRFLEQNQNKDLAEGGADDATVSLTDLRTAEFYSQSDYDRIPENQRHQTISDALARRLMGLARALNQ